MAESSADIYQSAFEFLKNEDDPQSVSRGLTLLSAEVEARPDDAKAWFELAGGYDFLGRESEALPHYEKVLELGFEKLPAEDRPRIFIQLGSTLRNLKKYDRAKQVIQEGIQIFPNVAAMKAFLGLVEYSDGMYRKAAKLFLEACAQSSDDRSLRDYRRALSFYSEKIDVYPARQRNWMRATLSYLGDDLAHPETAIAAKMEHAPALAQLMDAAYRGTIDHEGETLQQCLAEMKATIEGKYGPWIGEASFLTMDGDVATSASLITLWRGKPLVVFTMTAPSYQKKGLAGFLIRKSLAALKSKGYRYLYLVVTEGNTSAENLYRKLGFEKLGPALPGQAVPENPNISP